MTKAKQMLIDAIKNDGEVSGEIVKVDKTLNHMVNIQVIKAIGEDIAKKFRDANIDKVLTVEASGIPGAQAAAMDLNVDYIFAKKKNPITMKRFFSAESFSFTKNEHTTLFVSKEVLQKGDRILFVDDFYAKGNTLKAIRKIVEQAEATLAGVAVIIDKNGTEDIHSILTLAELKEALAK
ncbi:MAG: phosphoribosyltransferase [Denitrovibrio sp.]|nr:MAG: phosphoribosyltransferase [Denitrovibrio sp.]